MVEEHTVHRFAARGFDSVAMGCGCQIVGSGQHLAEIDTRWRSVIGVWVLKTDGFFRGCNS